MFSHHYIINKQRHYYLMVERLLKTYTKKADVGGQTKLCQVIKNDQKKKIKSHFICDSSMTDH